MKTTLKFEEPKKSIYRDYSSFSSECFKDDFDDGVQYVRKITITEISKKNYRHT